MRRLGGTIGSENFSGTRTEFTASGGVSVSGSPIEFRNTSGVIDISGQWIEPPSTSQSREFDKDDPSIRWVQRDKLWGLARADGSWLVEPKFQQADPLTDGLARVTVNGKVGFIDRTGNFAIEPVFDKAWWFRPGFGRTSAAARRHLWRDRQDRRMGLPNELPASSFRDGPRQGSQLRNGARLALQEG